MCQHRGAKSGSNWGISVQVLIFIILLASVATVASAEWEVLTPNKSGKLVELDTYRSKKIINNYLIYARTFSTGQREEIKAEINCSKKRYKLLYQKISDNKGHVIQESDEFKPWECVSPDCIFDVIMQRVCRRN